MKGSLRWVIQFSNSPQPMVGEKLAIIERSKMQLIVDGDKGKPFKRFLSEFMVLQSVVYMEKKWHKWLSSNSVFLFTCAHLDSLHAELRWLSDYHFKKVQENRCSHIDSDIGGGGVFQTLSMIWEALWLKHIEAPTFQKFPGPISVLDLSTAEFEHWELLLKWYRYIILNSEERCIRYWTYKD